MHSGIRRYAAVLLAAGGLAVAGCGRSHQNAYGNSPTTTNAVYPGNGAPVAQADTMRRRHHSIIAGAAAGAVAGHMMGHHAIVGAAAGALIQHERNKHQRRY